MLLGQGISACRRVNVVVAWRRTRLGSIDYHDLQLWLRPAFPFRCLFVLNLGKFGLIAQITPPIKTLGSVLHTVAFCDFVVTLLFKTGQDATSNGAHDSTHVKVRERRQ